MPFGKDKSFMKSGHSGSFDDTELMPYNYDEMVLIRKAINTNGVKNVPYVRVLYYEKHKDQFWKELKEKEGK